MSESESESDQDSVQEPRAPDPNVGAAMTATTPFIPKKPKYGDLARVGTDSWVVWTGGKPKADWTELEDTKPKSIQPNQYRTISITSQAKSQHYRRQGLETKFSRDKDIQTFERDVMSHLEDYGMDTITYIADPAKATQLVCIVTDHGRFNLDEGSEKGNEIKLIYFDEYDLNNMNDAKKFVYNSVDDELKKQLNENCIKDCSFIAYWLELINAIQSVSMERFDTIKKRIKERKIASYEGENIEKIVSDFMNDWRELECAGMYNHNLTLNMLNSILDAGGNGNEDFKFPLCTMKQKLESKLLKVRHLSYSDANNAMAAAKLDVQSMLKKAKDQYRIMYDNKRWPSALDAKDSKAMNKNFGRVNALVQNPPNAGSIMRGKQRRSSTQSSSRRPLKGNTRSTERRGRTR